jgi:hypothetical protein
MPPRPALRDAAPSPVDRWIAPYFGDSALWPVTIVLLAHGVLGIGVAALDAWRGGFGYGVVALVPIALGSVASWQRDARRGRVGATSGALLACWVLGLACAVAADRYGVY